MPTPENEALVRNLPLLHRAYVPNMLSWNAHLAGLFGYVKLPGQPQTAREVVTLPDGGTVALSWQAAPVDDGRRIVILFPGINNDSTMPYIRHLSHLLDSEGLGQVCAVDWRGLGGQPLRSVTGTPKPYCAAASADVGTILAHLRVRLPHCPMVGVGWSMGGCLLLRHMGESAGECLLCAAMAVSPLLDIKKGYDNFDKSFIGRNVYTPLITVPLVGYLWKHREALRQGEQPIDVCAAASVHMACTHKMYMLVHIHYGHARACRARAQHVRVRAHVRIHILHFAHVHVHTRACIHVDARIAVHESRLGSESLCCTACMRMDM